MSRRNHPAVLLTLLLAAGCGGSATVDPAAGPSSTPGTTSSSPAPSPSESSTPPTAAAIDPDAAARSAIVADYRRWDHALTTALKSSNGRVNDLVRFSTAKRLAVDRGNIKELRQRRLVFKGKPQVWIGAVTVRGSRATAGICYKDDSAWYENASGKLVGTRSDTWVSYEVRLLKAPDRWRVDLVTPDKKISCKAAS